MTTKNFLPCMVFSGEMVEEMNASPVLQYMRATLAASLGIPTTADPDDSTGDDTGDFDSPLIVDCP